MKFGKVTAIIALIVAGIPLAPPAWPQAVDHKPRLPSTAQWSTR